MNKSEFIKQMRQAGDAIITYISPNSGKEKFNAGTIDFSTPYIADKPPLTKVDPHRVIIFCWDTNKFKQIDYKAIVKVQPLNQVIENSRSGRRNFKYGT